MGSKRIPITVRPETFPDREAISKLVEAAFGQEEEARLVDALRVGDHLHASSVAQIDGMVVGHASLSRASIGDTPLLVLAPVSVDPHHQGRGIGTEVVRHVLATAARSPVCVLGEPGYYSRFGFVDAEPLGIAAPFPTTPGALQILRGDSLPAGVITYATPFNDL